MSRIYASGTTECHPDRKHHSKGLCHNCYKKQYYHENIDRIRVRRKSQVARGYLGDTAVKKKYRWSIKLKAMKELGGCCLVCGETDYRVLEFDHIDGGGQKDRRGAKQTMMRGILSGTRTDIQLLCANHHRIKTWEQLGYEDFTT